ncbi:MAG: FG-GAP repeat protein [Planctomycetes bacterium]|nr:FG-GAP repeat protein [Planctomycetota bacterium]
MHFDSIKIVILSGLAFAAVATRASGQTELFTFTPHLGDAVGSFGFSVAGAGDTDGDGFDDLVVGQALGDSSAIFDRGGVYLFSGWDGSQKYFVKDYENQIGWSVCRMGDLAHNGNSDFAFSSAQEDYCDITFPPTILKVIDGATLTAAFTFNGPNGGGFGQVFFGKSIDGGADIDGDGTNDLVMTFTGFPGAGTPYYRAISGATGADIYHILDPQVAGDIRIVGDIDGDGLADIILTKNIVAEVRVGVAANLLFTVPGYGAYSRVSPAGDVNLDGIPDFAVSDVSANSNKGKITIYSGGSAQPLYVMSGLAPGGRFGSSMDVVGDINNDGIADFAGGAPYASLFGIHTGGVQVHSGANGSLLAILRGKNIQDSFGFSLRGAGDVNGDGLADLIVGSPGEISYSNWDQGTATVVSFAKGLQQFGTGLDGCDGPETLNSHFQPKINSLGFDITCTNAPPSALGLALIGNAQIANGNDIFGIGIPIYVDVFQSTDLFGLDIYSSPSGFADVNTPIPNDPTLVGKTYFAQTIWLWPTGIPGCVPSPYYLSCSHGLAITIQQ